MLDKRSLLFIFLVCSLLIAGLVFSPAELIAKTLKLGHLLAPGSFQNQALVKVYKPYVEEKSGGSLRIEIFPAGQLGGGPGQAEGVKLGTQDMFLGSFAWYGAHVEETEVPNIPFMFDDRDHYHRWMDQVLVPKLMPLIIKKANQRFINFDFKWHRGPFRVICSKRPIFTPEDIKGLRLRLWPARAIQKTWTGMGAKIFTIDWGEAYLALKQNMVEAITSPFDLVWSKKWTEVAKYVTELRQFPQLEILSINEKVWQGLNKSEKKILMDAAKKAGQHYNEQTQAAVDDTIENKLIKVHNAVYIKVNRQAFVDLFRNKILPKLIAEDIVKEKWIEEVRATR